MKIASFKSLILLSISILFFTIIGCTSPTTSKENVDESKINTATILKYKNSLIGNNSAIGNIVNNLPANDYSTGIELQTDVKPYELTVFYKSFEDIEITIDNNTVILSSFSNVLKNNALILFSLVDNLEIINFKIDNDKVITYDKDNLTKFFDGNLDVITSNESSLKEFIKNNNK